MSSYNSRLASANTYDNAVSQMTSRQTQLSNLQEQLSASKKVLRASDDPTGAAQAERARTRMSRIATDQRALEVQKNSITTAEATLGDTMQAVQDFRSLVVQAGNTTLTATDRATIAQQLTTLRDQILGYANAKDTNGQPLFAGLGSIGSPFVDNGSGVSFDGIAGQAAAGEVSVPAVLDGQATFMDVPTGNGVFVTGQAAGTSAVWSNVGQVKDPSLLTGHGYRIDFAVSGTTTTYSVVDTTTNTAVQSAQPYKSGQAIEFDGISVVATGTPANGNALDISPSTKTNLFGVLDQAINSIKNSTSSGGLAQDIGKSLAQIDSGLGRLSASRGRAGDLLNQVDNITSRQDSRSLQLEADRSRAEDLDVVKALSEFQNQQTAYQAALGSYAQIQKLSLFNFIS